MACVPSKPPMQEPAVGVVDPGAARRAALTLRQMEARTWSEVGVGVGAGVGAGVGGGGSVGYGYG